MTGATIRKQSIDAEQAVLGSALIDPDVTQEMLSRVRDDDFSMPENRQIFQAMRNLFQQGKPTDGITVCNAMLPRTGVNWRSYLAQLMEITPTSANWREYATILRGCAVQLRIRELCEKVKDTSTIEEIRPLVADMIAAMGEGGGIRAYTMEQLYVDFCERLGPKKPPEYVRFGFDDLDRGIYPSLGDMVIIGAEPDVGKTAFSLQCAYNMAQKWKVGYFTLETLWQDIADRTIAESMQISYSTIKAHKLTEQMWDVLAARGPSDYCKRNMTVIEAAGYTPSKIQAVSQSFGFQIVFIDYVQLVVPDGGFTLSRQEQMASVSRALKNFGNSTGTMVCLTAQLTRPEKANWREPNMHSVKESGQYEQDADLMLMLYKPNPATVTDPQDEHKFRHLKIAKNKKGKWGTWDLAFNGDIQRFEFMTGDR